MAVSDGRILRDGQNIMLFAYTSNGYKSIAHASSHSLSISTETEEINTKDSGAASWVTASKYSWEITADHFYTTEGYKTFFDLITDPSNNELKVCFGLKNESDSADAINLNSDGNWTPKTSYVYYGTCTVSSLDWQADSGSKSTFSATLQGKGNLSYTVPIG